MMWTIREAAASFSVTRMSKLIRDIYEYRELLLVMVFRNIKIRYKGSVLGFFWSLLSPVFLILIYAVFLHIMQVRGFSLSALITGIIVWQFLALCLGDSLYAVLGNANLVKKTAFPRIVLPLSMVIANTVNFVLSLLVLGVYLAFAGAHCGNVLWLPLIILTHFALCLGVSLIFATANVFFRDTEHSLQIVTMAWFFLTPVIYPISFPLGILQERLPAIGRWLLFANPMVGIVSAYRDVLLSTERMPLRWLAVSFVVAWCVCLAGLALFQKAQTRFADEL